MIKKIGKQKLIKPVYCMYIVYSGLFEVELPLRKDPIHLLTFQLIIVKVTSVKPKDSISLIEEATVLGGLWKYFLVTHQC